MASLAAEVGQGNVAGAAEGDEDSTPQKVGVSKLHSQSVPQERSSSATLASRSALETSGVQSDSYRNSRMELSPLSAGRRSGVRRIGSSGDVYKGRKVSSEAYKRTPSPRRRSSYEGSSKEESMVKLKTSIRVRRKSLKPAGPDQPHTIVAKKNVNFAPVDGTKFHEALEITLKREQEGHNKYKMVKRIKKYRGMRSDSKAEKRAQIQKRRIAKRQRKGQKQKAKDINHFLLYQYLKVAFNHFLL